MCYLFHADTSFKICGHLPCKLVVVFSTMAPKKAVARKPNVAAMRSRLDDEFADLLAKERVQEADRDIIWFMGPLVGSSHEDEGLHCGVAV